MWLNKLSYIKIHFKIGFQTGKQNNYWEFLNHMILQIAGKFHYLTLNL